MLEKDQDLEADRQKKNLYKQTLLYQQAMNEHNKHNFGKMTYAGKHHYLVNFPLNLSTLQKSV